jgi:hypothetical protein
VADAMIKAQPGFDHGVGHSLLLLYDAKTPRGQKIKKFNQEIPRSLLRGYLAKGRV